MVKRRRLAGLILSLALAGPLHATPPTTAIIGTPPQPGWGLLSTQQKIILAPLATEWDQMENIRRKKWLGIAERFPKITIDEQSRVQQRMRDWASLTPEKRARIRDSYKEFSQLPPEKRQAVKQKWEAYSNLSEEEKRRVRRGGKSAKPAMPAQAATDSTVSNPSTAATPETGKPATPRPIENANP